MSDEPVSLASTLGIQEHEFRLVPGGDLRSVLRALSIPMRHNMPYRLL